MAYREVTMLETQEILRQWWAGEPLKRIAAALGLDPKTVRRYVRAAKAQGLSPGCGDRPPGEDAVVHVLAALRAAPIRARGEAWLRCEQHREHIEKLLGQGLRLSKLRKLLRRDGIDVPYGTLYRFAVHELGFGRTAATVLLADGKPGHECQIDTGWVGFLAPDPTGKRRRFRAWIFTPAFSRLRFVWPCFRETTESAIEACEAAWSFYGGVFHVLIPDNPKALVDRADPLHPRINPLFLEYAQARGFVIDTARVRHPRDKARTERSVRHVRDDCFAGETLHDLRQARDHAERWCRDEDGLRRHSRTQRLPRELFDAEEKAHLLPAPDAPYDLPIWANPKIARDHHAQVALALYSLPTRFIGKTLHARADSQLVRFYDRGVLVKTHPRQPRGGRSTDPSDFPPHKTAYAQRDIAFLQSEADGHGEAIGRFAQILLDVPLPWTRMRRVYALLALVKRYGAERVEDTCVVALAAQMDDVRRLRRMLEQAATSADSSTDPRPAAALPARHLRPVTHFAIRRSADEPTRSGDPS